MDDWEAYLADTHPQRPTVEPAEDERPGTTAPGGEPDPTLPPRVDHAARQRVRPGGDHGRRPSAGADRAGKDIERHGGDEQIPESDEGGPGGEEQETNGTIRGNGNWLLTSVGCHEPAYPLCYTRGWRGGAARPLRTPGPALSCRRVTSARS